MNRLPGKRFTWNVRHFLLKNIECHLLQILLGALRDNSHSFTQIRFHWYQCIPFKSSPKTKRTLLLFITIKGLSNINFKASNKIEVSHCHTFIDKSNLTFTTLWANSADDKLTIFFYFFSRKIGFDISCKLSPTRQFAWMSDPIFWHFCT